MNGIENDVHILTFLEDALTVNPAPIVAAT